MNFIDDPIDDIPHLLGGGGILYYDRNVLFITSDYILILLLGKIFLILVQNFFIFIFSWLPYSFETGFFK